MRCFLFALTLAPGNAFFVPSSHPFVSSHRTAIITLKEAAAKAAWLAKLDQPVVGGKRMITAEKVAKESGVSLTEASDHASEVAAKNAWLAKLDQPKLGVVSEAAAKAAWLQKIEESQWRRGIAGTVVPTIKAKTQAETQTEPMLVAPITSACAKSAEPKADAGNEDTAKKAWLAKLDQPKLGRVSEAAAKAAWLAKIDQK